MKASGGASAGQVRAPAAVVPARDLRARVCVCVRAGRSTVVSTSHRAGSTSKRAAAVSGALEAGVACVRAGSS